MHTTENKKIFLQAFILALSLVSTLFIWQGNKGFSLWDEGFLWYGVQRVLLGEIPIRDFMSYDPGRYYLSAALLKIFGDSGIISLRIASVIVQFVGLFVGLLLVGQGIKKYSFSFMFLAAVTMAAWMFAPHKIYDVSISIILVWVLTYLLSIQCNKSYFFSGIFIGLIAVFGRNHGIYGIIGSIGVFIWIGFGKFKSEWTGITKGVLLWVIGIIIGFSPLFFMILFVPGFAVKFWEGIRFLFEVKSTNISLPIPWPWRVDFSSEPIVAMSIHGVIVGMFYMSLIAFSVLTIPFIFWRKFRDRYCSPVLIAASFLSIPYAHYAYSRADVPHLAHSIFPMLIGCLYFINYQSQKIKLSLAITLCVMSLFVMHVFYPGWQSYTKKQWVNIEISGDKLLVDPKTAREVNLLRSLYAQYVKNGGNFLVTPFWPGAYSLLNSRSPIWEIYALSPRTQQFEKSEIERIKVSNPSFILVIDKAVDGRDDLRFQNTHPLTYQFIVNNYQRISGEFPNYQVYINPCGQ